MRIITKNDIEHDDKDKLLSMRTRAGGENGEHENDN